MPVLCLGPGGVFACVLTGDFQALRATENQPSKAHGGQQHKMDKWSSQHYTLVLDQELVRRRRWEAQCAYSCMAVDGVFVRALTDDFEAFLPLKTTVSKSSTAVHK